MTNYKHGDWYCKPSNEDEAKEIIERAVASGAVICDCLNAFSWDDLQRFGLINDRIWGVIDGVAHTAFLGEEFQICAQNTIAELRQKFPLPGEQVEEPKQWHGPEDGLPPVGTKCEYRLDHNGMVGSWWECSVKYILSSKPGADVVRIVIWCPHLREDQCIPTDGIEFRQLRTERERWVEAASNGLSGDMSMLKHSEFILGQIYDAMQSGQLKAPSN